MPKKLFVLFTLLLNMILPFASASEAELDSINSPILNVQITANTLEEIKAHMGSRYYYTDFSLLLSSVTDSIMFRVDTNPLDQYTAIDNNKMPAMEHTQVYPVFLIRYDGGLGSTGTSYSYCHAHNGTKLKLDPNKIIQGSLGSTYITYTGYNGRTLSCTCIGAACLW